MKAMKSSWLFKIFALCALPLLAACAEIGYCVQCVTGHLDVMGRSRPIAEVLDDQQIPEAERKQLAKVLAIRDFATGELGLPDNNSYRIYANLGRPYVVWNVVATPEFSLAPKQWCFPVVGCLAYRGYFSEADARTMAAQLAAAGYDVDLYGVKAYSTLNWFDDPVLNTFIDGADSQLAALMFHELAHQVVYVADDCAFNEAFAKTVEMEGLRRWLRKNSTEAEWHDYLERDLRSEEFLAVLSRGREQLARLYAQSLPADAARPAKRVILERLESDLRTLRDRWPNPEALDSWLESGLNNARLASIATYRDRVPAFQGLLNVHRGDLPAFYAEAARIARLPADERLARLSEYGPVEAQTACKDLPAEVYE